MNQIDFAEIADCSTATIQAIEVGRLNLSPGLAAKISIATGVSEEWLLANKRKEPIRTRDGRLFSKKAYEHRRATLALARSSYSQAHTPDRLFAYYQIMRRVLARLDREKEAIAIYRIEEFLRAFVREFTGKTVTADAGVNPLILDLIEADLKSAKKLAKAVRGKFGSIDDLPDVKAIAAEMKKRVDEIDYSLYLPQH